MKFVSLSYVRSTGFHNPSTWLERIRGYGLVLEALARKHDVVSVEQIDYEGSLERNGVKYYFILEKHRRFPSTLHRLVKKINPDVVIVHGLSHPLQVIQLRRILGKQVTVLVQSHADKIPAGFKKWLQKIADPSIDGYLFTSFRMADGWTRNKVIRDPLKIKEVMVGASLFKPTDKQLAKSITKTKGEPIFLFVGRVDANKDPITLIKAFSEFSGSYPSASLYCIFQNEENRHELENAVNESRASNAIHLVGKIEHKDMEAWYNSADFIVSTSHAEAFGMAVAEAMSCGCFPILSNIPSFRKITNEGECGLLFEPGNVDQLMKALHKAAKFDMSVERRKIVQFYNAHLSAEAIAEQIYIAATSI